MLLIKLKKHLQDNHFVSLFELMAAFNIDPDVLREMLKLLIRKNIIRLRNKTNQCGSTCFKCNPFVTEIYEWVGA
jgi:putative ferrous iron transport protein C